MGLLDELSKLGIKNVDATNMYEKESVSPKTDKAPEVKAKPVVDEKDFVFLKSYICPVCEMNYKSLTLKTNKARLVRMDKDLRPIFEDIEPLKYEVVTCPRCGYSVTGKYLIPLTPSQKKGVIDNISASYEGGETETETVSYESALKKMHLAFAACILKNAKASEKAYTCLKGGWLCRAYRESLEESDSQNTELIEELKIEEKEFLDKAYEGFIVARESERFPIAGMDSPTLDYVLAVMSFERGKVDVASKMIAAIFQSASASPKIKDKARDLKNEILKEINNKKAAN